MSDVLKIKIEVDDSRLPERVDRLLDEKTMLQIHNLFAKMCDPYVPFLEGPLSQSALAQVTPDYVQYGNGSVPYAHYQYYGTEFNHTLDYHPKATALWDKVMMSEQGELFIRQVKKILERRAKELYG